LEKHLSEVISKNKHALTELESKNKYLITEEKTHKETIHQLKENNLIMTNKLQNTLEISKKNQHEKDDLLKANKILNKDLKLYNEKLENSVPREKVLELQNQLLKINPTLELTIRELNISQKETAGYKDELFIKTRNLKILQEEFIRINSELKIKIDIMNNTVVTIILLIAIRNT